MYRYVVYQSLYHAETTPNKPPVHVKGPIKTQSKTLKKWGRKLKGYRRGEVYFHKLKTNGGIHNMPNFVKGWFRVLEMTPVFVKSSF